MRRLSRKTVIPSGVAAAAVLAAILGAVTVLGPGASGDDNRSTRRTASRTAPSATPSPTLTLQELVATAATTEATDEHCQKLASILTNAAARADQQRHQVDAVTGLRESAAFVGPNPWALAKPRHQPDLERAVGALLDPMSDAATGAPVARADYAEAFTVACALVEKLSRAEQSVKAADAEIRRLKRRALRAPWWPPGYSKLTSDVAWKGFTSSGFASSPCGYLVPHCLKIHVMTRIDCGSVYLEVNALDGSRQVVDWSNDSLGVVDAGQPALMEFESFADSVSIWKVTRAICN